MFHETTIRLYIKRIDFINDPSQPYLQIPVNAIEDIVTDSNLQCDYINLIDPSKDSLFVDPQDNNPDPDDSELNQELFNNKFMIVLKDDFLKLFIRESYCKDGLDDEELFLAKHNKLESDDNTNALVKYYASV